MTIDVNVHEPFDQRAIDRYLDPVWHGWHPIIPPLPYRIPGVTPPMPSTLRGVLAETESAPASIDDVLAGREAAVLTGTVHPGNAVTQFEYHTAFTRAYNDWLAAEWLARDPVYGSIQVMSQLPGEAAGEIDRLAANPKMLQVVLPARGGEGFGIKRYRPIFDAASRHGLVVAFHVSASTRGAAGFPESLAEWHATAAHSVMGQILSLAFSGLFEEHPDLKVLLVGGGWAFLPYLMWTMDSNYRPLRAEVPWVKRLPSEYVRGRLFFSAHPLPAGAPAHLADMIRMAGDDGWLVWGSDFPNRGWGRPDELDVFPEPLRRKILVDNARAMYASRLA